MQSGVLGKEMVRYQNEEIWQIKYSPNMKLIMLVTTNNVYLYQPSMPRKPLMIIKPSRTATNGFFINENNLLLCTEDQLQLYTLHHNQPKLIYQTENTNVQTYFYKGYMNKELVLTLTNASNLLYDSRIVKFKVCGRIIEKIDLKVTIACILEGNQNQIYVGSTDGSIRCFDESYKEKHYVKSCRALILELIFNELNNIISASMDKNIIIYTPGLQMVKQLKTAQYVSSMALMGNQILCGCTNGMLQLFDSNLEYKTGWQQDEERIDEIEIRNNKLLLYRDEGGQAEIYSLC